MEEKQPAPLDTVELTAEPEATVEPEAPAANAPDSERNLHIMLDIETWSTDPNALIISVGACAFDPKDDRIVDSFYVAIDPASSDCVGRHICPDTIMWWMDPERTTAREQWLRAHKVDLYTALEGLNIWAPSDKVWGNGPAFDNNIMMQSYKAVQLEPFWRHWNDRCYRTIKNLDKSIKIVPVGEYHNALDDALGQAMHMQQIVRKLGLDPQ